MYIYVNYIILYYIHTYIQRKTINAPHAVVELWRRQHTEVQHLCSMWCFYSIVCGVNSVICDFGGVYACGVFKLISIVWGLLPPCPAAAARPPLLRKRAGGSAGACPEPPSRGQAAPLGKLLAPV